MLIEGTTLTLPGATEKEPDQVLHLAEILTSEGRQQEVAYVTPVKAPELLHLFNYACLEVGKLVKKLAADIVTAKKEVDKRKATILLYEVEDFLKTKDLSSTKDTRDAYIVLDTKYQALQDRVDQLVAAREWLALKMDSFENSYSSVKKIMGEDAYNMSLRTNNPNLSGGGAQKPFLKSTPSPYDLSKPTPTQTQPRAGYGKSRYDRP